MRGKGTNVNRAERTAGITPACAGKRTSFDADMANSGDHPRVCGEKKKMQPRKDKRMGSPPRVRGKAQESFLILCHHGITPACAGKRTVTTKEAFQKQDHPRVCGEKPLTAPYRGLAKGSPPRVRGKEISYPSKRGLYGITPACAGKRRYQIRMCLSQRDHPRVCGEKQAHTLLGTPALGSPPRVRGKVCGHPVISMIGGITPACAGKRLKRSHSIGHFSCILCLFHSVLHRASVSGGSRAGPCAPPCLPAQNAVPV